MATKKAKEIKPIPNTLRSEDCAVCPPHPGTLLKEDYIETGTCTITGLAKTLGVSRKTISAIVNGRQGITPEMSLLLGAAFQHSPHFWLDMQNSYDMWHVKHRPGIIERLKHIAAIL